MVLVFLFKSWNKSNSKVDCDCKTTFLKHLYSGTIAAAYLTFSLKSVEVLSIVLSYLFFPICKSNGYFPWKCTHLPIPQSLKSKYGEEDYGEGTSIEQEKTED